MDIKYDSLNQGVHPSHKNVHTIVLELASFTSFYYQYQQLLRHINIFDPLSWLLLECKILKIIQLLRILQGNLSINTK